MTQHSDQAIVAAYDAQGRLVLEERALPALQDGEVRLAVDACGICGSDLHAYDAGWLAVGEVPGHETAGTVVECGSGALARGTSWPEPKLGPRSAFGARLPGERVAVRVDGSGDN